MTRRYSLLIFTILCYSLLGMRHGFGLEVWQSGCLAIGLYSMQYVFLIDNDIETGRLFFKIRELFSVFVIIISLLRVTFFHESTWTRRPPFFRERLTTSSVGSGELVLLIVEYVQERAVVRESVRQSVVGSKRVGGAHRVECRKHVRE